MRKRNGESPFQRLRPVCAWKNASSLARPVTNHLASAPADIILRYCSLEKSQRIRPAVISFRGCPPRGWALRQTFHRRLPFCSVVNRPLSIVLQERNGLLLHYHFSVLMGLHTELLRTRIRFCRPCWSRSNISLDLEIGVRSFRDAPGQRHKPACLSCMPGQ